MKLINDEDYLAHFNTPGSKWGYNKGKRNGGRVAQDPDFIGRGIKKIGSSISDKINDARDFLDYDTQEARRARAVEKALDKQNQIAKQHYYLNGNIKRLKDSKYYQEASNNYNNALNEYNKFQKSAYGKILRGIKKVSNTITSSKAYQAVSNLTSKTLSAIKSTKAYQTGVKYTNRILKGITYNTSKQLTKVANVGRKIMTKIGNSTIYKKASSLTKKH